MKYMAALLLVAGVLGCQGQGINQGGKTTLATKKDSVSYGIGFNIGRNLVKDSIEVSYDAVVAGMKDALVDSAKRILSKNAMDSCMRAWQNEMLEKQMATMKTQGDKNKAEGDAFLAQNKTQPGVVTLPDGLQYKVIKEGTGQKPKANQTVTVNYRGTLLNGEEFDNSYKRGEPATFQCGGLIKGWNEALQLMKVGSKWQVWIPADLAYGERGAGGVIPPNATLAFEMELLSVK
ncbi:MAG TPA: FKBP-type peptidyl-prolyl cis-trans isomerase [Bacteroidota bacterium]|nr:FKBP-type peptidyl-prolyl cis-trans isomerase [Bacteroidota bacterium]